MTQKLAVICPKCNAQHGLSKARCLECGTSLAAIEATRVDATEDRAPKLQCLRCQSEMDSVGKKRFHEGTNWGALGELGEHFVHRQELTMYVCPRCRHVEFFAEEV